MPEYPADRLQVLLQRVERLEEKTATHEKQRDEYFADSFRHRADTQALLSMMREMAAHAGVAEEHVEECFSERARFYHDEILRIFEDSNPMIAGLADDRHPAELPEEETFRPLFDSNPPPGEG
jgi:uncharacterized protein (UPF0335 family)